jgi:hypothetical protein
MNTVFEGNSIELKALYKEVSNMEYFPDRKNLKIRLWNIVRDITPYEELSANLQKKRDMRDGCYPRASSKYFKDISIEELEEMVTDIQGDLAQNMNDWRMYRDRVPERYVSSERAKVGHLKELIELKNILAELEVDENFDGIELMLDHAKQLNI